MFSKIVDGASKLKAKIGGDELDEKLIEVVSEENWQASTQQLHQIASAAYNYEKWQRINEFIWEKLKKSKSWKKILKTFNLIEFLLKNGPPSIISNFKYDMYQLRVFESYSNYVDGLDKGEPIRERAKTVVALLNSEDQLQEERVKAKAIRDKMSNIVGGGYGSGSGGYGGSGYGGSGSYGGYDSGYSNYGHKEEKKKKNNQSSTYNYGNSVGHFGDYTYSKSTIDKYRDTKNEKPSAGGSSYKASEKEEKKEPEVQVQTKKPFEKAASKLSKPGAKKPEPQIATVTPITPATVNQNNNTTHNNPPPPPTPAASQNLMDIMDSDPTPPPANNNPPPQQVTPPPQQNQAPPQQQYQAPPQQQYQAPPQQQYQAPPPQQNVVQPPPQQQYQVPPQPNMVQPSMNNQPQQPFNPYGQVQAPQQPFGQVPPQQPYGQVPPQQFYPQNQMGQPQPQPNYGYQQPQAGYPQQIYPQQPQGYNQFGNQMQGMAPQQQGANITLDTGKKQDQFGNFASSNLGTAQDVKWLSNKEKGLIDFSDFGSEIKKENKPAGKNEVSNNIQIDNWSW